MILTRLWSWLGRLFGGRSAVEDRSTAPAGTPEPVPPLDPQPEVQPEPEPEPQPEPEPEPEAEPGPEPDVAEAVLSEDDLEEDDEEASDDEDDSTDDEPDPFITHTVAPKEPSLDEIAVLRTESRAEALAGEHRVLLSSPAGPGSLAEALNALLDEGLVEADFIEDDVDGPLIHYRPLG